MAEAEIRPEERTLVEWLDQMDGEAEAAKADYSRHWEENAKLVKGDGQWRSTRTPLFLMNIIGNQYERKVAQVSESKPTFAVLSRTATLGSAAKVLDKTCRARLEEENFPLRIERLARCGMVMGSGLIATLWSPLADDVQFVVYDPRAVYLDPGVTEAAQLSQQALYVRIDHVMPLHEISRLCPGRGSLVQADARYSGFQPKVAGRDHGVLSAVGRAIAHPWKRQEGSKSGPFKRAVIKEYWVRDPDVGSFPGGRRIIRGDDLILKDDANEYWDGEFPFDMLDWRMDLESPYGYDDIQDLKKIQEALNRVGDAVVRNALFNSQTWVIADTNALDPQAWKAVTNEGGLIVKKRPMRDFRREPPPALPAYLFQLIQALPGMADLLTGNADSAGRRAGKGAMDSILDGLQTAGSPLARMIARRIEALVARVGKRLISRIIQFYMANRLLSYHDPSGELIEYLYERSKLLVDDEGKSLIADELPKLHNKFRFLVQPYSSMAMTKMQRAQVSLGLWQASLGRGYPFKRVLEHADVGDADMLLAEAKAEQESGMIPMPQAPVKR